MSRVLAFASVLIVIMAILAITVDATKHFKHHERAHARWSMSTMQIRPDGTWATEEQRGERIVPDTEASKDVADSSNEAKQFEESVSASGTWRRDTDTPHYIFTIAKDTGSSTFPNAQPYKSREGQEVKRAADLIDNGDAFNSLFLEQTMKPHLPESAEKPNADKVAGADL